MVRGRKVMIQVRDTGKGPQVTTHLNLVASATTGGWLVQCYYETIVSSIVVIVVDREQR